MPLAENTLLTPEQPAVPRSERFITATLAAVTVILVSFVVFVFSNDKVTPQPTLAAAVGTSSYFESVSLSADAAIVLDIQSGEVLYEKNADTRLPLASLTKVPLAFVVAESLDPQLFITLQEPLPALPDANGIAAGARLRVQDLIDYTLAASSNEGAVVLSRIADGAIRERFPEAPETLAVLWRMNTLAGERRLSQTSFANPTGLDVDETTAGAYGSARDTAWFFAFFAEKNPDIFAKTTKSAFSFGPVAVGNTNQALSAIPGFVLGKTGFTDLAGGNLAVVFEAHLGRPVAIVVLGSTKEGRFADVRTLVNLTREALE